MWTSSTATPAASGRSLPPGDARKTSSGRSRLPPAASASRRPPRRRPVAPHRRLEPLLELVEVGLEAGNLADRGEHRHAPSPVCSATMPAGEGAVAGRPRSPRPRSAPASSSGPGKAAHARGQVRVGGSAAATPCRAAARPGRTRRGRTGRAAPVGVVISRIPSRPPATSTRRELARAPARGRRRCGRRSRRSPRRTLASSNGSASRSPSTHVDPALAACALEHPRREVEPDDLSRRRPLARRPPGRRSRSRRRGRGRPGRTTVRRGDPPPALVEPGRHHAVHHVVDRRDPVEHRPHPVGRERPRLGPPTACAVIPVPSGTRARARARAGRGSGRR